MDEVAQSLRNSEAGDQAFVDKALDNIIAEDRKARGKSAVGGSKPSNRTRQNAKMLAATGPNAKVRHVAFSRSDAREIAVKSVMSSVSYEIGLGALLYHVAPTGDPPRETKVRDELAEKVSIANDGLEVRSCRHCFRSVVAAFAWPLTSRALTSFRRPNPSRPRCSGCTRRSS